MRKSAIIGQFGVALLLAAACSSSSDKKSQNKPTNPGDTTGGGTGVIFHDGSGDEAPPTEPPKDDLIQLDGGVASIAAMVDGSCGSNTSATEPKPVAIEFVVDVSTSMNELDPAGTNTKWNITRQALVGAMAALPETAAVGVEFYPCMTGGSSTTPRPVTACINTSNNINLGLLGAPGSTQRGNIDNALLTLDIKSGWGTPTLDAYKLGLDPLRNVTVDKFLILITDGQPTFAESCVGDGTADTNPNALLAKTNAIVAAIGDAYLNQNVRTFVIGSPGSEKGVDTGVDSRGWLSQAASAGGTAIDGCSDVGQPYFCHFDMTQTQNFSQDLATALRKISSTILSCVYSVPTDAGGLDPTKTNVIFIQGDGTTFAVAKNEAATCEKGWHYTDSSQSQIEICGTTCDRIMADPEAQIQVLFGCAPVVGVF